MKKILIISPHFPPSNLAAVHRSRLFAQHLPSFGWQPVVLMVDEKFYEEALDENLSRLLPAGLRIERSKAFNITRPRFIGDIGLRAFFQLYKKAKQLIENEQFDFLYIPIPSFYVALLGRWLHETTGIKYGVDYIDPWVHSFPGSEKKLSRHWWSSKLSQVLEPIAVKKAALITGVAEGYYKDVFKRNPHLAKSALSAAMPYGGEKMDHERVAELKVDPYIFKRDPGKIQLVYAGAMLPKAYGPLAKILKAIAEQPAVFSKVQFYFIGTGKSPNDADGYNIRPYAEKYGLWQTVIFEHPKRIPYLDVLVHLEAANGVFILGSTEPHYTPSKVYQGILSGKPILAILHQESLAAEVISKSKTGICLTFDGENDLEKISNEFVTCFKKYLDLIDDYNPALVNMEGVEQFSALSVTRVLAEVLDKII